MFFFIAFFAFLFSGVLSKPQTVSNVNLDQYTGRWYQVYGSPTNYIFQGYGKCLTADYGSLSNGSVSVLNAQVNRAGDIETISGYAYCPNSENPGQLLVYLEGTPVDAPYWIVQLGEVVGGQYQYSIITVPSQMSLWVITRNVSRFYEMYSDKVRAYLDAEEYKYSEIYQEDDCVYV